MLADGLSRTHVAERMRISVHTVSTLARRVSRTLGDSSQAALAARLAGHARRRLGERQTRRDGPVTGSLGRSRGLDSDAPGDQVAD